MPNILKKTKQAKALQLVFIEQWLLNKEHSSFANKGIIIRPYDDVELLAPTLNQLPLIAVDFSDFEDGRGYSQVKLLRKKMGYSGEIRALNVHIDHLQFILRSGVNSYELLPEYKKYDADYVMDFNVCYQAAEDNTGLFEKHKYSDVC